MTPKIARFLREQQPATPCLVLDVDRVEENFRAWLVAKNLTPEQAQYLSLIKNRGLVKGKVSLDDLFAPPLSILNAANIGIELFGEQGLQNIMDEINQSVLAA